jgi:putative tricarboxylic transport membrane protein
MTYTMEKRMAGTSGTFGAGDVRGVAAPEAANNASAAGSFVPMLTLGVPGSGTTAVMVGALSLYNITPGPALFTQNPTLVWGLIASLFIANAILLVINIPLVGVFAKLLQLPNWLLVPGILAVSAVGVYSVHATTFDLLLMSGFGLVAFLLRKQGVPMAPLILGFVLGDLMEQNLRRALSITNGQLGILVESPISKGLWICAAAMVIVPPLLRLLARRRPVTPAAAH